ncbi:MAG: hypothetical protein ABI224_10215 [Acetobacteraceae bacterium]
MTAIDRDRLPCLRHFLAGMTRTGTAKSFVSGYSDAVLPNAWL